MKKTTSPLYCTPIIYLVCRKSNLANTKVVKNFKQELIKVLLLEVKKSTQVIASYNTSFFLEKIENKAPNFLKPMKYHCITASNKVLSDYKQCFSGETFFKNFEPSRRQVQQ